MTFVTSDARIPASDECVLRYMLEKRAAQQPNDEYVVFDSGDSWTYAETLRQTRNAAAALQSIGVAQDDKVLLALPNGPDALRFMFGANYIGAVAVPVNAAYKGRLLERVVTNSEAKVLLCLSQLAERLVGIDCGKLETVVLADDGAAPEGFSSFRLGEIAETEAKLLAPSRPILPFDLQCIIYTSGTTGPSKGVMCSYLHLNTAGRALHFMTRDDRYMINLPMYHVSGILPCMMMMTLGGSVAIIERFRTEEFWETIERTGTTFVILLGVMTSFVLSSPNGGAGTTLKKIIQQPYDGDAALLKERFGLDVYATFNMTEISIPLVSEKNPSAIGACGRPRAGVEVRLVDEWDCEVPVGEVGELLIRTDQPWAMNHGYYKEPGATAEAWRNGWFHTGDGFRRDEADNFFFVDRLKDTIRRRGENISSFEVEAEVISHPEVREVAAVSAKSDISESEVLIVISLVQGAQVGPAELIEYLKPRLPYFMVPRYIRILPELPKTPTQKIEKHLLRAQGLTSDVWDRETAGIRITRDVAVSGGQT